MDCVENVGSQCHSVRQYAPVRWAAIGYGGVAYEENVKCLMGVHSLRLPSLLQFDERLFNRTGFVGLSEPFRVGKRSSRRSFPRDEQRVTQPGAMDRGTGEEVKPMVSIKTPLRITSMGSGRPHVLAWVGPYGLKNTASNATESVMGALTRSIDGTDSRLQ